MEYFKFEYSTSFVLDAANSISKASLLKINFFTAFAFLNMVIGIVVSVLEDERANEREIIKNDRVKVDLETLHQQLVNIQQQLGRKR